MFSVHQVLARLLFAAGMGAMIGLERDLKRRPAGIRTSMFVCLGAAMFTMISAQLAHVWGDSSPTRIASNIVQGIGFLGAGAILRDNAGLVGLTTAATIFVEAAIGMAAGGGFYGVAAGATGIVLFGLLVVGWAVQRFSLKSRLRVFRFTADSAESLVGEIQKLLSTLGIVPLQFRVSMAGATSIVEFQAELSHHQEVAIVNQLHRQGIVTEVAPAYGQCE